MQRVVFVRLENANIMKGHFKFYEMTLCQDGQDYDVELHYGPMGEKADGTPKKTTRKTLRGARGTKWHAMRAFIGQLRKKLGKSEYMVVKRDFARAFADVDFPHRKSFDAICDTFDKSRITAKKIAFKDF